MANNDGKKPRYRTADNGVGEVEDSLYRWASFTRSFLRDTPNRYTEEEKLALEKLGIEPAAVTRTTEEWIELYQDFLANNDGKKPRRKTADNGVGEVEGSLCSWASDTKRSLRDTPNRYTEEQIASLRAIGKRSFNPIK